MSNDDGKISFKVELDNSQLKREISDSREQFRHLSDQVVVDTERMDNAMSGLGSTLASLGLAYTMQEFARKVFDVRSEIQKLQVSFTTLLGSARKADALFNQIKDFAVNTPMQLNDLASAAQMMLSFNIPENDIMKYLKALGDVSMGDTQKFQSLSLAFSQMSSTGKLMGQDLLQMINTGFNPLAIMAEKTGKSIKELKDEMSEGKITAEMVQQAFIDATSEGGKYCGMLEAQSKTLAGAYSNLQGAMDDMFNAIGEDTEGIFAGAIDGATFLVKHYEEVGDVLMTLVATYGVYKATLMATTAFTNSAYSYEISQLQALLATKNTAIDADLAEAVAKGRITEARAAEVQALRLELEAKIEELRITAETTRVEAEHALQKRMAAQVVVESIQEEILAKEEEIAACEAYGFAQTAEGLRDEKNALQKQLNTAQTKLNMASKMEAVKAEKAQAAAQALSTARTQKDTLAKKLNTTQTKILTVASNGLKKALNAVKAAFATNPLGMILMGVTLALGALMTLNDAMSDSVTEMDRFGESAVKQSRNVETLFAVIDTTSSKSKVHQTAVDELVKIYEDYGIKLDHTIDLTQQLIDKKDELIAKIKEEGEETQKANLIASYEEALKAATTKMKDELQKQLKEAELDGSGLFDDWDADDVQERAEELATVISAIYESEAEEIAKITDDAEREARITEAHSKAVKAYQQIMGFSNDENGYIAASWSMAALDVDFIDILDDYIDKTDALIGARQSLIDSYNESRSAQEAEAEAVDYTTMEFDQLFDAAFAAEQEVAAVDNSSASPTVDKTSIDNANNALNSLLGGLNSLLGTNFTIPTIDLTKIPGWSTLSDLYNYNNAVTASQNKVQQDARDALEARFTEAVKTRKGTADLLKEVNKKLETATTGSSEEKQLLSFQKRLQDQQKKFNKMSGKGTGGKHGKSAAEIAADVQKAELHTNELIEKSQRERDEMVHKYEMDRLKNDIALEKDAAERRRKQLAYDHQNEQDQLQNQLQRDIDAEIARQKALFDAKEAEKKAADSKYVKKNFTTDDIDQSQIDAIRERYAQLDADLKKIQQQAKADLIRADLADLRTYLQNYGTYQQQKLAIATEYADKIRKAQSEGERRSLQQERDSKLTNIRANELRDTIDWSGVFGGFGGIFNDYLAPILKDAKEYTKKDQFKQSDQASQKALLKAITQMEEALGGADKVSFAKLGADIQKYQAAQNKLREAEEDYAQKYAEWTSASEAYTTAVESGTEAEQQAAKERMDAAEQAMIASSETVQSLQLVATEAQNTVSQTAKTLKESVDGVMEGLRGLASGGISSAYQGFIQLGKSMKKSEKLGKLGDAFGKVADKLEKIPIIGWIVEIIDILKDGLSVVVKGLLDAVFDAVSGIIGDVLNFKDGLFRQIGESLVTGIGNIFKSIFTLGGWFDWIGGGDSDKHYERDMVRLADTNEALEKAIEKLTKVMEDASVADASDLYKKQIQLLDEEIANKQEQMIRSGKAYSNGVLGIGGAHSSNTKINNGMSSADWSRINQALRSAGFSTRVNGASDFWKLSPEEMRAVLENAPVQFAKIKELADDGYKDAAQFMDDYLDFAEQREELEKAYREKLTSFSFDSIRDEFKSCLTDMSKSAADFSSDFNKMLIDSISEALMTEKYDPMIKALYEKWAKLMEDGELSDSDVAELQREKDAIFNSMKDDREFLKSLSTSGGAQQSSSKGFATASQDSIDELNGRFTAIQIDTSVIRETLSGIGASISAMNMSATEVKQTMDEIRNISLLAIDHLEAISKNTHELYEMNERLGKIEKNTRNL